MDSSICKVARDISLAFVGGSLLLGSSLTFAGNGNGNNNGPVVSGNCKDITASSSTEFHGNPSETDLSLAMAGNQWVVFNKIMSRFNERRILNGSLASDQDADLEHQATWTQAALEQKRNKYFIELIPPGKERAQILSGCMIIGNEKDTNFLPLTINLNFDVFTSTNYNEPRLLAEKGFVESALPYTKNQLTLMVAAGNPSGFATSHADPVIAATLDLLSNSFVVSEVDHIDEGIHAAINGMYKKMDAYVRASGDTDAIAALDAALAAVATPQANSPADCRFDTCGDASGPSKFTLATNPECNKGGHLQLCEFAILNKANTHETRVHHVETPSGILAKQNYVPVDVGPVWVSELQFAKNAGDAVDGVGMPDSVNAPKIYPISLLASGKNQALAEEFINFMLEPGDGIRGNGIGDAQDEYEYGGFNHMTCEDFAQGEYYSLDGNGDLVITARNVSASCP